MTDWFEDQVPGRQGLSPTRTIGAHDVALFAGLTGDMAELHTSDTFAAQTEFGGRIAHGILNLALAHGLVVRSGRLASSGLALLGWSQVRFLAPVHLGDTVRATWETIEVRASVSRPDAGIVRDLITLRNHRGATVLTGEVAELVRRRPT